MTLLAFVMTDELRMSRNVWIEACAKPPAAANFQSQLANFQSQSHQMTIQPHTIG